MRKGQRVIYGNYNITITVREVLFSIAIFFIMLTVGFFISEKISSAADEVNQKYYQAVKISDDTEIFQYGMRTNIGNAFVHGKLEAVGAVSYEELDGEYAYVEKVKERYTEHTEIVNDYDEDGNIVGSHTETKWTWDKVGSEEIHCDSIRFLNTDFEYGRIGFPGAYHVDTIKVSSEIRYKYYVCDLAYVGSIYADLRGGTVNNAVFINEATVEGAVEHMVSKSASGVVAFWIFWIVLTGAAIYGFCYFDNRWLED